MVLLVDRVVFVGSNERTFQVYALYGSATVSLVGGNGLWTFGREPGTRGLDHDCEEYRCADTVESKQVRVCRVDMIVYCAG